MFKDILVKHLTTLIALGCVAAASVASASGYEDGSYNQNRWPHWYIGVQGSIPFLEETDVTANNASLGDLDFDAGYGIGASLGYTPKTSSEIINNMRFEGEYYFRNNDTDEINAQTGVSTRLPGEVTSQTFMVNTYYDFDTGTVISPYLGGGVGMSKIELDVPSIGADDKDNVFAYQLMAGLSWAPENLLNTELNLGYRYLDASDPEFATAAGAKLDHSYEAHNLEAGARFRF
jgi:opacity protein-like surface antigen